MSDNDYESHRRMELRTPIIKSLNDKIKIENSNDNIKGYKELKDYNILLQPKRLESIGIIYPYLLTDSLINLNENPTAGFYYMGYYSSSFEFLDISGAYPVRIDYMALKKYTKNIKRTRTGPATEVLKRKIMNDEGGKKDFTSADKEMFLDYKYNFMSGTENQKSIWKTNLYQKYHSFGGNLGYLYLTKLDVVKLFELMNPYGWEGREIGGGHSANGGCSLCDGDYDVECVCENGMIPCQECEEGQIECEECGGGGYGTCDVCEGDGNLECIGCEGRGQGGDYGTCDECNGEGEIQEECDMCEGGKVDCDECDATGKDDEGEECVECDGSKKKDCQTCDGENEITKTCENCDGGGEVGCDYCGGEGRTECEECGGEGEIEGGCDYCDYGSISCDECGGDDEIECPVCEGSEYVKCVFNEGENLNDVDIIQNQEPFSANYDWKLNRGKINPEQNVYWIVEAINFNNWYEADISQLKELLSSWSDDNVYGIDSDAFGKLSNFNVVYTLATPKGLIKNALKIYFVWNDDSKVFNVIRMDGELPDMRVLKNHPQYKNKELIYYYLSQIRLLNWSQINFDNLKY
jgi:hypothetical protein